MYNFNDSRLSSFVFFGTQNTHKKHFFSSSLFSNVCDYCCWMLTLYIEIRFIITFQCVPDFPKTIWMRLVYTASKSIISLQSIVLASHQHLIRQINSSIVAIVAVYVVQALLNTILGEIWLWYFKHFNFSNYFLKCGSRRTHKIL